MPTRRRSKGCGQRRLAAASGARSTICNWVVMRRVMNVIRPEVSVAETASGKYPVETVAAMAAICQEAEKSEDFELDADFLNVQFTRIDQSIAYGALFTAYHLRVKAIVALTESGSTTLWMSRHNIDIPLIALTPSRTTQRKIALYRNVRTYELPYHADRDTMLANAEAILIDNKVVQKGDTIVVTWGEPMGQVGGTNALKIVRVGE